MLRSFPFGEADRVLHLYTPDRGRVVRVGLTQMACSDEAVVVDAIDREPESALTLLEQLDLLP